jgi:hypothetical protein
MSRDSDVSFNGRWLAFAVFGKAAVVRADGRRRHDPGGWPLAWAPHRLSLAYVNGAVNVFNSSTGVIRKVTSVACLRTPATVPCGRRAVGSLGTAGNLPSDAPRRAAPRR